MTQRPWLLLCARRACRWAGVRDDAASTSLQGPPPPNTHTHTCSLPAGLCGPACLSRLECDYSHFIDYTALLFLRSCQRSCRFSTLPCPALPALVPCAQSNGVDPAVCERAFKVLASNPEAIQRPAAMCKALGFCRQGRRRRLRG